MSHKHNFYLAYTTHSVRAPRIGSWWTFTCRCCGASEKCHSSKFWSLFA